MKVLAQRPALRPGDASHLAMPAILFGERQVYEPWVRQDLRTTWEWALGPTAAALWRMLDPVRCHRADEIVALLMQNGL